MASAEISLRSTQKKKQKRVARPERVELPTFWFVASSSRLKQTCWAHVRRLARRAREVSLEDVAGWEGEDSLTVVDLLDYRRAAIAEAARPARAHEQARYAELRRLIETLDTLTRRVLRLRYVVGLELPEVCRRVGRGQCTVSTASASAIRKLQRRYGIEAKADRVKHFSRSNHVTHHVNKRTAHPDCPYCWRNIAVTSHPC